MNDIYVWIGGIAITFFGFLAKEFWSDLKAEREEQAILKIRVIELEGRQKRGLEDVNKLKEQREEDQTTISKMYTRISKLEDRIH